MSKSVQCQLKFIIDGHCKTLKNSRYDPRIRFVCTDCNVSMCWNGSFQRMDRLQVVLCGHVWSSSHASGTGTGNGYVQCSAGIKILLDADDRSFSDSRSGLTCPELAYAKYKQRASMCVKLNIGLRTVDETILDHFYDSLKHPRFIFRPSGHGH